MKWKQKAIRRNDEEVTGMRSKRRFLLMALQFLACFQPSFSSSSSLSLSLSVPEATTPVSTQLVATIPTFNATGAILQGLPLDLHSPSQQHRLPLFASHVRLH